MLTMWILLGPPPLQEASRACEAHPPTSDERYSRTKNPFLAFEFQTRPLKFMAEAIFEKVGVRGEKGRRVLNFTM